MKILLVDDSATQRVLLASMLKSKGYSDLVQADSAGKAFDVLGMNQPAPLSDIDLILMDLNMPDVDGLAATKQIKAVESLRDIPIIVVTASADLTDLQASFNAGAMDYLTKPPNAAELTVRVRSALQLKEETDRRKEREASLRQVLAQLEAEREHSESLLLNILPPPIVERLKNGESVIADDFPEATVFFADVVGFTNFASEIIPVELVALLNELFAVLDEAAEKNGLEKIKTMGDAYIAVSGVPIPRSDHIEATLDMALDVRKALSELGNFLEMRIGIQTGSVVAGIIGTKKFTYDLWGDTVNVASRMQSTCGAGEIQVTADIYERAKHRYIFEERGLILIKGKGEMQTYVLSGKK